MEKYEFAIEPELVLTRQETSEARLKGGGSAGFARGGGAEPH